ncbi:hypothetical protein ACH4KV_32155 [Streptomyces albidoflavus]
MTTTPRTARHLLRDREASLILGAVLVSGFGSSATALVAGVWVKELTASDSLAALATAVLWAAVPRPAVARRPRRPLPPPPPPRRHRPRRRGAPPAPRRHRRPVMFFVVLQEGRWPPGPA